MQGALRDRYGIAANQAHRALDDAIILNQLLPLLLKEGGIDDLSELMDRDTKCTGTIADITGPGTTLITVLQPRHTLCLLIRKP